MPAALLISNTTDPWTEWVARAITARGGTPLTLNLDRYPEAFQLGLGADGATIRIDGRLWREHELSAVWGRRPDLPRAVSMDLPELTRRFMLAECERAVMDWLAALRVPHVDDNFVARIAANKPRQIRDAAGFGFTLRPTWLGNDPEEARAFIQRQPGSVIAKPFTPASAPDGAVFANRLSAEDIEAIDTLDTCPMIFQGEVVGRRWEARVTLIGDRVIPVALDAVITKDKPDFRRTFDQDWKVVEPPEAIVQSCIQMADAYGLQYAAYDFIVTEDGEWVFLELNPVGECFWLDEIGLDASGAIAELLLNPAERCRPGARWAGMR